MNHASSKAVPFSRDSAATPATATAAFQDRRTAPPARLTPRQVEVLALLCEGMPNKLICRALNIATGTVKVHMSCIFRELGVTSRLQAVVAAHARALPTGTAQ
jgi:DNA-binding NarL/FixJ family response regulator